MSQDSFEIRIPSPEVLKLAEWASEPSVSPYLEGEGILLATPERPGSPEMPDLEQITTFEQGYQALLDFREATFYYNRGTEEEIAEARRKILEKVEERAKFATDPYDEAAIRAAGDLAVHHRCAKLGEPLPKDSYIDIYGDEAIAGVFKGDTFIYSPKWEFRASSDSETNQYVSDELGYIRAHTVSLHPFIQKCLAIEKGVASSSKRPLSPYEKLVRKTQLAQEVQQKFGVCEGESLDLNAQRYLTREELRLDDEVVRDKSEKREDPNGVINFVLDFVNRRIEGNYQINTDDNKITDFIYNGPHSSEPETVTVSRLKMSLRHCLEAEMPEDEFAIATVIAKTVLIERFELKMGISDRLAHVGKINPWEDEIASPVTLIGKVLDDSVALARASSQSTTQTGNLDIQEVLEGEIASNTTIERIDPENQPGIRLGIGEEITREGSLEAGDLILKSHRPEIGEYENVASYRTMRILGYTALSAVYSKEHLFIAYKRDETDLYQPCATEIDVMQQAPKSIEHLIAHGAMALVSRLERNPNMTVSELAQCIASNSDYLLPEETSYNNTLWKNLDGISEIPLEDGRLQIQCSTASQLLALIINEAWPGSAQQISGHSIRTGQRAVTMSNHAQTLFIDPISNEKHILDPTPALTRDGIAQLTALAEEQGIVLPDGSPVTAQVATRSLRARLKAKLQKKPTVQVAPLPEPRSTTIDKPTQPTKPNLQDYTDKRANAEKVSLIKKIDEHRVDNNKKIYEDTVEFYMNLFDYKDRRSFFMYEVPVVRRNNPSAVQPDPLTATLKALQSDSTEEREKTLDYVRNYQTIFAQSPKQTKQFFKLREYPEEQLAVLVSALEQARF